MSAAAMSAQWHGAEAPTLGALPEEMLGAGDGEPDRSPPRGITIDQRIERHAREQFVQCVVGI